MQHVLTRLVLSLVNVKKDSLVMVSLVPISTNVNLVIIHVHHLAVNVSINQVVLDVDVLLVSLVMDGNAMVRVFLFLMKNLKKYDLIFICQFLPLEKNVDKFLSP